MRWVEASDEGKVLRCEVLVCEKERRGGGILPEVDLPRQPGAEQLYLYYTVIILSQL